MTQIVISRWAARKVSMGDTVLRWAASVWRLLFGLTYNPFSVRLGIRQAKRGEGRMWEDVEAELRRRFRDNAG